MKRTPLLRKSPLRRTGGLKRTQIAPRSRKKAADDRRWATTRVEVLEAADGRCARCGGQAHHIHHVRGRVGSLMHDKRWLVALCAPCHGWTHANPAAAREVGLMEKRNAA